MHAQWFMITKLTLTTVERSLLQVPTSSFIVRKGDKKERTILALKDSCLTRCVVVLPDALFSIHIASIIFQIAMEKYSS